MGSSTPALIASQGDKVPQQTNNVLRRIDGNGGSTAGKKRGRLQVYVAARELEAIEEIKEMTNTDNNNEIVRDALRVYHWVKQQQRDQYEFQLVKDGRVKTVELLT